MIISQTVLGPTSTSDKSVFTMKEKNTVAANGKVGVYICQVLGDGLENSMPAPGPATIKEHSNLSSFSLGLVLVPSRHNTFTSHSTSLLIMNLIPLYSGTLPIRFL